jgi:hypothetical protein
MRNIYRLEKFRVLTIESNSQNHILTYKTQVNEKLAETLFKLTDNTFKIDFEFTQLQYLEFIKVIEKDCYNKEFENLVAYWENEKLKFISPNERLSELIKLRDYYNAAYFSDSNVLQYYCVHNKEELSKKLAKFGKYEPLIAHPDDIFKNCRTPKEILKFVIYCRFIQLIQFETLNNLIIKSNSQNHKKNQTLKKEVKAPTKTEKKLIPCLINEVTKNSNISKTDLAVSMQNSRVCVARTVFTFFRKIDREEVKVNEFTAIYLEKYSSIN